MSRYLISDHHFDHKNIIDYCNRPFESVSEMNSFMIECWNKEVGSSDSVIYVGDLTFGDNERAESLLDDLNGNKLILKGNHDSKISGSRISYPVVESTIFRHEKYRFWCTHRLDDVPQNWTEWIIHGHSHNDEPFIHYDRHSVNVSVECLGYKPIPLSEIATLLNNMSSGEISDKAS